MMGQGSSARPHDRFLQMLIAEALSLMLTCTMQDAVKVAQQFMKSNGSIQFNLIALCAGPAAD